MVLRRSPPRGAFPPAATTAETPPLAEDARGSACARAGSGTERRAVADDANMVCREVKTGARQGELKGQYQDEIVYRSVYANTLVKNSKQLVKT